MSKKFSAILLSALLSSLIFLVISINNLDFIMMFVATVPLFTVGLNKDAKSALEAGVLAAITIFVFSIGSIFPTALYFFAFAIPSYFVCHLALRHYDIKLPPTMLSARLWYPAGLITVYLALYFCIVMAIAAAVLITQDTSLPKFTSQIAQEIISIISKDYDLPAQISPNYLAFILCGSTAWLWCFLMFGYAWSTNYALQKKNLALRPNLSVLPFPIPHWLLTLMSICALASIIGGESISFLGKSAFFTLLIPYFFQGAAMLNITLKNLFNNMFFIIIFYFIAVITFWPAMIIVGIGIWNHIKILNKHLSSDGSSSKS